MAAPPSGISLATSREVCGAPGAPLTQVTRCCCPVGALLHSSAAQLLRGLAFPGPLGASLLPHLCLHRQCHRPVIYSLMFQKFLWPSSGCAGAGWRGCGGAQPTSPATVWSQRHPRRCRLAGMRSQAPRRLCPRASCRSLISAGLRAALLLPGPSPPPSAFTLSACSLLGPAGVCPSTTAGRAGEGRYPCCQWLSALGPQ